MKRKREEIIDQRNFDIIGVWRYKNGIGFFVSYGINDFMQLIFVCGVFVRCKVLCLMLGRNKNDKDVCFYFMFFDIIILNKIIFIFLFYDNCKFYDFIIRIFKKCFK